ncbi:MAG: acyltransferase family protein [Planctomycetes bacterium]|nr:acyltransferase family protein [Planctomycetota bacterium]
MEFSLNKQTVHSGIDAGPEVGIPFDRRHDLDALRAGAMLLGIGLHAALAYMTVRIWPVYDDRHHAFFDTLFSAVHGFRMPLFFMISGFFTAMLWRKRGLSALIKHRAKRIILPLLIFIIPVQFSLVGVLGFALSNNVSKSEQGQTSVDLWSAAKNNDTGALGRYLQNRESINKPDPETRLPALNWAALNGSTEAARMLIEAGADVNVRTEDGSTSLGHAAFMGNADIVALLIENGAELNSVNSYQATPLDSLKADWGVVQWIAGMLNLQVDRRSVEEGRKVAAKLLRANGGMLRRELGKQALAHAKTGGGRENDTTGGITEAYLSLTDWQGFREPEIFGHLWFLWFLCILIVPFAIFARIADALNWAGLPKWLFLSPVLLVWLVPITMIPQWFHGLSRPGFGPDTSSGLFPLPHIVLLYGVFFYFGALYFDCDDPKEKLGRFWGLTLPVALLIVYPLGMALSFSPDNVWIARWVPDAGVRPLAVMMQALYPWLMIFGLKSDWILE